MERGPGGEVNDHTQNGDTPLPADPEHPARSRPRQWFKLKPLAHTMRHEPTPAEEALWQRLRDRQVQGRKFRRQHTIGPFIVDFYCPAARLVIEVDGVVHENQREYDAERQELLAGRGLHVLRFTSDEVLQEIEGVLAAIAAVLTSPPPR